MNRNPSCRCSGPFIAFLPLQTTNRIRSSPTKIASHFGGGPSEAVQRWVRGAEQEEEGDPQDAQSFERAQTARPG